MGQAECRWMLTVNDQGAIPPAKHKAPGISNPSGILTLLFSCIATA